jgi:NADH-quinone oxidoreductase subunit J
VNALFYIAADVAVAATILVITSRNTVHALLNLVVSLLAVALMFAALGAAFVAALEVIIYAGAIIVLFLFAVMLLDLRADAPGRIAPPRVWIGPGLLALVLLAELVYQLVRTHQGVISSGSVGPAAVGSSLYTTYAAGVELASMLLLAGLIGARHLGRRSRSAEGELAERLAEADRNAEREVEIEHQAALRTAEGRRATPAAPPAGHAEEST